MRITKLQKADQSQGLLLWEKVSFWVVPLLTIIFLGLFWGAPRLTDILAKEDGWVETLTALFFLGTAVAWFVKARQQLKRRDYWQMAGALILGLVLFVFAMEEISWTQRIIGSETTGFFATHNQQGEINLHNFNTRWVMSSYYIINIFCLGILPLFKDRFKKLLDWLKLGPLAQFIPALHLALPFLVTAGLTLYYEQIPFNISIFWVIVLALWGYQVSTVIQAGNKQQILKTIILAILAIIVGWSVFYYPYQTTGIRRHLSSEYLELISAVGFMVYTIDYFLRNQIKTKRLQTKTSL